MISPGKTLFPQLSLEESTRLLQDVFCDNNPIVELTCDPTNKFQKLVKKALTSAPSIIKPSETYTVTVMNPQTPRFFGLPKIHKTNVPIRPVVSSVAAPSRKLASHLNSLFREVTGFKPRYGVKNSTELCQHLTQRELPSSKHILVSFDVKDLFTNIPISEAVKVAEETLKQTGAEPPFLDEFLALLRVCVEENYFKFNGKFFQQKDGLAMGSPLSPLLADLYMNDFEERLFSDHSVNTSFIHCWYRFCKD
ncbi:putative nicotine oxidoreductase [Hetaerina americana]|uniref:putative nicotine oxidoreductase n=1 Tax=Hetaerina americana TaxID=62018 RepID=UPI003A7F431C